MIAIIKNVKEEGPGSIETYLKTSIIPYRIFEAQEGDLPSNLDDYTGLIIMGGPMGVYEMEQYPYLRGVAQIIEKAINKNLKVLGICLGAQLIAHVLGAKVFKGPKEEIGWFEVELTPKGLEDPLMLSLATHPTTGQISKKFKVFQWHGDTFELPSGAIHLARSTLYENQAFKFDQKVYALQFHVEVTKDILNQWFNEHPFKNLILKESEEIYMEYSLKAKKFYAKFFTL
ncbi:type 1 glutamine amidotransferase [Thermodesulfobacterium hveragerdense]|uniref:type 1 glutamine amidotransferase n=1 Tax=Thermodesulfobacterium hveragerdense TaxID=53424 RepID=UPI0003F7304A|nr:type 1 glutamine amidotransferase [Thermodesulfobacterium hveragerdense]